MNSMDTPSAPRTWTLPSSVFLLLLMTLTETMVSCTLEPLSDIYERQFTCGKLYYRTLHLHSKTDTLYVGAMDKIFRLNLTNIRQANCDRDSLTISADSSNGIKCRSEEFDCRNHIKVIQPVGDGNRLYICGTNAYSPKDWMIYTNLTHVSLNEYVPGTSIGKCPYDPSDNSTAIWVNNGNPDGIPALYSGTNADFEKSDALIYRTDLYDPITGHRAYNFKRTVRYDYNSLNEPNFVGSFEIGPHVFFFFREFAQVENSDFVASVSRVARVCKSDTGGESFMAENWVTFRKARLNCSVPGEFTVNFNEIQSVYKVLGDDNRFYGIFATSSDGIINSAICSFHINAIQEAFSGKLKKRTTSGSSYSEVHFNDTIELSGLQQCVRDTKSIPDSQLVFIRDHPLVESVISQENEKAVFYTRETLNRLVVDKVRVELDEKYRNVTVYYAGSNNGLVYKIVQWIDDNNKSHSSLLDLFDVTPGEPIRAMEISKKHGALYVASDHRMKQIDLALCLRHYDSPLKYILDPYCGWEKYSYRNEMRKTFEKSTGTFYFE